MHPVAANRATPARASSSGRMFREASRRARLAPAAHLPWRARRSADNPSGRGFPRRGFCAPLTPSSSVATSRRQGTGIARVTAATRARTSGSRSRSTRTRRTPRSRSGRGARRPRRRSSRARVRRLVPLRRGAQIESHPRAVPSPPRRSSDHRVPRTPLRSQKPLRPWSLRDGDKPRPTLTPVFLPHWVFDIEVSVKYRGKVGFHAGGGKTQWMSVDTWKDGGTTKYDATHPAMQICASFRHRRDLVAAVTDRTSGNSRRLRLRPPSPTTCSSRRCPTQPRPRSPPRATARARPAPSSSSVSG